MTLRQKYPSLTVETKTGSKPNEDNMKKTNNAKPIPLVVTTAHKGVFFGYGTPTTQKTIRLTNARMCVYWSVDVKSVVGLAATGPSKTCRIGPAAPAMTLYDVTSAMECSPTAAEKWETSPWA